MDCCCLSYVCVNVAVVGSHTVVDVVIVCVYAVVDCGYVGYVSRVYVDDAGGRYDNGVVNITVAVIDHGTCVVGVGIAVVAVVVVIIVYVFVVRRGVVVDG